MNKWPRVLLLAGTLCASSVVTGQANQGVESSFEASRSGVYRTREERREAGLGTQLTDWLTFSGLVEVEHIREVTKFDVALADHHDFETDPAVQAAFDVSLFDFLEAELIFQYSEDPRDPVMDELIVSADAGPFGFSVGRFYAPFGLYFSHFINGPLLEFGETRRDMIEVDFDFEDTVEFSLFALDGKTSKVGTRDTDTGWGATMDALFMNGRFNLGGGYLSNLAESDERFLLEENNQYQNKVGAWNAYGVFEGNNWDLSFEILQATDRFRELDATEDNPSAWNLETAYFPNDKYEIAFRYERSKELIEKPQEQYGVALTWRPANQISVTMEYLHANYKKAFVEEDDDIFVTRGNLFAVWFAYEF